MSMIKWDPKVVDLSPGLAALSDAVDSTNAAKWKRKEMERQRLRDEAADRYNQAQMDNLKKDNERADKKAADERADKESADEANLFINLRSGKTAEAKALAQAHGWNIAEGKSAAMPGLKLDDPTADTGGSTRHGLSSLLGGATLRAPDMSDGTVSTGPAPDAPDVGYGRAPGIAGLLGGKKLNAGPGAAPDDLNSRVKAADWADKTREWDAAETENPNRAGTFSVTGRSGMPVYIDPEENNTRMAVKRETDADKWLASAGKSIDPNDADMATAAKITRDNIASGEATPGQGMQFFQSEYQRLQGQRSREKIDEADRLSREKIAGMRRHGGGAGGGGGKPLTLDQKLDNNRQNDSLADNMLNQHLSREEYKDTRQALASTKALLTGLESKNVAAQRAALGVWAKQSAGPGTVQQSERDEFVNTVGGKDMSLRKKALEWLGGGEVPEEQLKIFAAAARDISLRQQMERLSSIQEDVRDMFASHPNDTMHAYADWAANRVGRQYLPRQQTAATPGGSRQQPNEAPTGPRPAASAPGGPNMSYPAPNMSHPEDGRAIDWAKQHLNDPKNADKAKAILQANGGG